MKLAGKAGFEPATVCLSVRRSALLSYLPFEKFPGHGYTIHVDRLTTQRPLALKDSNLTTATRNVGIEPTTLFRDYFIPYSGGTAKKSASAVLHGITFHTSPDDV